MARLRDMPRSERATRVLIADDHPVVCRGLRDLLSDEDGLDFAGQAGEADTLLERLRTDPPDVLVLDLSLPGTRGLELLRRLRAEHSDVRVVVLSIYPEEPYALRALKAGAAGYVEKSAPAEEIVGAIRMVAAGRRYLSDTLAERLLGGSAVEEEPGATHETLSEREFQVLCRIGSGSTVSEIADELSLSVKTVSTYRARLLTKMGLRTNAEITRYVFEHELLPL